MKVGDVKKMREALEKIRDLLFLRGDGKVRCTLTWDEFNDSWLMCKNALTAKPRNCDVGTVDEQIERFNEFCNSKWKDGGNGNCNNCPFWVSGTIGHDCQIKWSQMPYYEKGGAE